MMSKTSMMAKTMRKEDSLGAGLTGSRRWVMYSLYHTS